MTITLSRKAFNLFYDDGGIDGESRPASSRLQAATGLSACACSAPFRSRLDGRDRRAHHREFASACLQYGVAHSLQNEQIIITSHPLVKPFVFQGVTYRTVALPKALAQKHQESFGVE